MFKGTTFLVIKSTSLTDSKSLVNLLKSNGASHVYVKDEFDNSKNYLESPTQINHIISESIEFIEYPIAIDSMVPITSPKWVYDSLEQKKIQNLKPYNPDPKFFLRDVFICCADNLPSGDKEIIYGGIKAFGGNYLDVLTKYTTHLVAVDLSNEKSIIASSIIDGSIKIVVPEWVDRCIVTGKHVPEDDYLLPNPKVWQDYGASGSNETQRELLWDSLPEDSQFTEKFLDGKKIYIGPDYHLSQRQTSTIDLLIERHGGMIVKNFSTEIDIYLGKYRQGTPYVESCLNDRIIVGNLQWLYHLIVYNKWILPQNSNILHYPIPIEPVSQFNGLKISITNYSGDSRAYLSRLITIMGGTFTKTLTKDNDYLICAKAEGKKYETAKERWHDENGNPMVKIVNHIWLEDCFINWKLLDWNRSRYIHFEEMESLIGQVRLNPKVLGKWYKPNQTIEIGDETVNVDDSMSEDETHATASTATSATKTQSMKSNDGSVTSNENKENEAPVKGKRKKAVTPEISIQEDDQVHNNQDVSSPLKQDVPPPGVRYGGRSAAKKAAAKLHDNMSDLLAYQEMSKSSRRMKTYMEELEQSVSSPTNKRSLSIEEVEEDVASSSSSSPKASKTKKKKPANYDIIAIMTGCESEINLSRTDCIKLEHLGILLIFEISKTVPNTLIAPKILRTEKFLRSLSKVKKIIHPSYLIDLVANIDKPDVMNEINIDDYSLDKIIKTTYKDLGYKKKEDGGGLGKLLTSPNQGILFQDLCLNLSSNLNGGVEVISNILADHGMREHKEIKPSLTGNNLIKLLIECKIENETRTILVANKTKDTKLIKEFKKLIKNGIVLEWDWFVKSIFKMELQSLDQFKL
ncbi:ESC4 [[Candida] subhashii]|uniref:ESC4 n=1 Tax=[Candida] subhashii TaxID=561895 RepID=A0A8J5UXZ8_9ASCO|nr:ESC4 [[Candida] subhashii]KAG7662719.1 ESC4 [[Candida] subhashii]